MKPSKILRSLSSVVRLSASSSSAVAPLPIRSSFDQQITAQLDLLQSHEASHEFERVSFLFRALNASTTTQQITLDSLANFAYQDSDRKIINEYLDYNTKMLDTCNELTEKIEIIQKYIESLMVVSHLLHVEGNVELHPTTLARAGRVLDSCQALERRCNGIEKCGFRLSKSLSFQRQAGCDSSSWDDTKLSDILSGSMAVTSMVCGILGAALSFKSKRSLPTLQPQRSSTSWSCSLQELEKQVKEQKKSSSGMMLMELQDTVMAARAVRDQIIKRRKGSDHAELDVVEKLKRNCGNLEEKIKPLEGRVKVLYKQLINVRMALLGKLSQM